MRFYIYETQFKSKPERKCIECEALMFEGYIEEESGRTWCDDPCLRKVFTEQEQEEAYNEEGGGLYWTVWHD